MLIAVIFMWLDLGNFFKNLLYAVYIFKIILWIYILRKMNIFMFLIINLKMNIVYTTYSLCVYMCKHGMWMIDGILY